MRLLTPKTKRRLQVLITGLLVVSVAFFSSALIAPPVANARGVEDIQEDINDLNGEVNQLDKKIEALENDITEKQGEIKSLENKLAVITNQIDKLELEIEKTQKKIERTEKEIEKTTIEIKVKEEDIKNKKEHLEEFVRLLYELSQRNMFDVLLSNGNFSDILNEVQYTTTIQGQTQKKLDEIQDLKKELETKKQELESQHQEAIELRVTMEGQKLAEQNKRAEQDTILEKTKGEEAEYQKILSDTEALQKQVIADIKNLEDELASQGSSSGGGNAVPPGNGILKWPVANGTVTQEYGKTSFGNGVYPGGFHNGLDIADEAGTPILSAHDGTVIAAGSLGGVAYGNWVAIEGTSDGLVTMYGHMLSSSDVSVGQAVSAGDVIGHMGSTGFSTGYHLHFTVFTVFLTIQQPYGLLPYGSHVNPRLYL